MAQLFVVAFCCLVVLAQGQTESDWDQEARDEVLKIHNDYRRNEGGCQMNKLVYDMDIELQAKAWAQKCVFEHQYGDYGENLAWDSNHNPETELIQGAAKAWFDEKNDFTYGQDSCGVSCHYTQLVWGKTQKIGCWSTRCGNLVNAYKDAWYIVCFYTPKGNWMGENPYGKQCEEPCFGDKQTVEDGLCVGEMTEKCEDKNDSCQAWADHEQCEQNPDWMLVNCRKACKQCE